MSRFQPSPYSGLYDDLRAAASARYDATVDTVTAPLRAATAAAERAEAALQAARDTAADTKAAAEAARETAAQASSWIPWIAGAACVGAGLWAASRSSRGRVSNPSSSSLLTAHSENFSSSLSGILGASTARGAAQAYGRGLGEGVRITVGSAPAILRMFGVPV